MGKSKNFEQVFGSNRYLWLLPVYSGMGNGYEFETNGDIESLIRPTTTPNHKNIKKLLDSSSD